MLIKILTLYWNSKFALSNVLFKLNFFPQLPGSYLYWQSRWYCFCLTCPGGDSSQCYSFVLTLLSIWSRISKIFLSDLSSETLSRIPWMSRLLRLLYWFCLFRSVSNSEICLSNFSMFRWSFEFFHAVLRWWSH